jgi:toxin ParE1/3/4
VTPRFHPEAQEEFIESALYYESTRPGLGQQFRDAVRAGLDRIVGHPEIGAARRNARILMVDGFPYDIVYRAAGSHLEVLALAHHRRRPGYWRRRV